MPHVVSSLNFIFTLSLSDDKSESWSSFNFGAILHNIEEKKHMLRTLHNENICYGQYIMKKHMLRTLHNEKAYVTEAYVTDNS